MYSSCKVLRDVLRVQCRGVVAVENFSVLEPSHLSSLSFTLERLSRVQSVMYPLVSSALERDFTFHAAEYSETKI